MFRGEFDNVAPILGEPPHRVIRHRPGRNGPKDRRAGFKTAWSRWGCRRGG